jgi:hypothetical protein
VVVSGELVPSDSTKEALNQFKKIKRSAYQLCTSNKDEKILKT